MEDSEFREFKNDKSTNLVDKYVSSNADSLFPLLLMAMDQGTVDLQHFMFMRDLKNEFRDLDIMVILTKFSSGWNGELT